MACNLTYYATPAFKAPKSPETLSLAGFTPQRLSGKKESRPHIQLSMETQRLIPKASEVGTEFKKYFEMLFQKKRINEGRAKLLLKALGRKKILQPSREKVCYT